MYVAPRPLTLTNHGLITASTIKLCPGNPDKLKAVLRLSTETYFATSDNIIRSYYQTDPYSYILTRIDEGNIVD